MQRATALQERCASPPRSEIFYGDALGSGNANVADGVADGDVDVPGEGDDVDVGEGVGVGLGAGVGGGGIIFSQ